MCLTEQPCSMGRFVYGARSVPLEVCALALESLSEDPKGQGWKHIPDLGLTEFKEQGRGSRGLWKSEYMASHGDRSTGGSINMRIVHT